MSWLRRALVVALVLLLAAAGVALWLGRRALPQVEGQIRVAGLSAPVEILRDRWGVPHIFASWEDDAYFGLGWAVAQDRLFQLEMNRRLASGRLSEIFGPVTLEVDRLFRTMDFDGVGRRTLGRARPEVLRAAEAYARGINEYVATLDGRLPIEFALLGIGFEPARAPDFAGILGFMAWRLNLSWYFDPLYERLVARVGEERASELFPYNHGGSPSVYPAAARQVGLAGKATGFRLSPVEEALVAFGPTLRASNNWVVGPGKSATGRPILCNDPHLAHALPGIWYEAHLSACDLDVAGVTVPGFPFVVIGHNRDVAWGMTNLMLDAADFFVERLDPGDPDRVMSRGEWVRVGKRIETLRVKGRAPVDLEVRTTPHGPLVGALLEDPPDAPLAYQWNYAADREACEPDGFYALDRARTFEEFRSALRRFGALAQNVVYADREGHIGMQAAGAIPRLRGPADGTRFRAGWDGSEDWDGFVPFEEHPWAYDPPEGWLASANNPTLPSPSPYYLSSQWEPVDRIRRIRERLAATGRLSVEDMKELQADTVLVSAREVAPLILEAFRHHPPTDPTVARAVKLLEGWNGDMATSSGAAALFAGFLKRLFGETFADELGDDLVRGYLAHANVWAIMLTAALEGNGRWFDRVGTREVESRDLVLRASVEKAVADLIPLLGADPTGWTWGRIHTLELQHPLARGGGALGLYFNRGPFSLPGHNQTVNKGEFGPEGFAVLHGPSMRQITDFSDLNRSLAVLPGGQSGIPASPHYDDMTSSWLAGRYHRVPMDRAAVEAVLEGRLVLVPGS